jgi:HK97 family phage major capsid protein
MTPEEEKNSLLLSVEQKAAEATKKEISAFKEGMKEYANAADIEKRFTTLSDQVKELGSKDLSKDLETVKADMLNMAAELKASQEKEMNSGSGDSFIDRLHKDLTSRKDAMKQYKTSDSDPKMVLNVNKDVTSYRGDISGNTNAYRVPGIGQLQRRNPFLRSLFTPGKIGSNNQGNIRYTDQVALVNGAAAIAEKGPFPRTSSLTWIERTLPIEKIGDSIKLSREMMDDVDYVVSEIKNLLTRNVDLKIDVDLLTGNGNTPNLKGLITSATAFVLDGGFTNTIKDASYYDLVSIISAQIMYGTSFVPNGVLMNPYDAVKMKLKKDELGNYTLPPFSTMVNGGPVSVDGVQVVTNSGIAVNTMYVGDFSRGTVYSNDSLQLEFGYVADDFTNDLVTLKARERLALLIREVDAGAFQYVSDIATLLSSSGILAT